MREFERKDRLAYLAFHGFGDHALVGVLEEMSYRIMVLDMMGVCEGNLGNTAGRTLVRRAPKYSFAKTVGMKFHPSMSQVTRGRMDW